mmetsp:Transcript_26613/g.27038  ORF Transcript_26613/g.27038 Transcript_26613/m.27038 type:complete len:196 (+) Transcript_26613:78-665(+)
MPHPNTTTQVGMPSGTEQPRALQLHANASNYRKQGEPCSHLRHLVDKKSRTARNNFMKATARMIDSTRYTGEVTGYETKVMVLMLEYFEPLSSAGGGSGPPNIYERPMLTVMGSAKDHMKALGQAYGESAKKNKTDNFFFVPLLPDNQIDIRVEPQVNTIISAEMEDRFQPSLKSRDVNDVLNDKSFENSIVDSP